MINVWCNKNQSKHSSDTVLCLLWFLLHQTLLSCHATFLSQHWHFCILILIFYCTVCRFYILNYFIFNYFIYMYRILGCFCRNELFYWIHLCIWLSGCLIKGHFSAKTVFSALFDCSTHTHQLFSTSVKSILYNKKINCTKGYVEKLCYCLPDFSSHRET